LNPIPGITEASLANDPTSSAILKGTVKDLYYLTPIGTIDGVVFGLLGPRGGFRQDPRLTEQAIKDERNPFCAQCHGPGGALDPNNSWNLRRSFEMRFGKFAR
jgi:hypothetical protein